MKQPSTHWPRLQRTRMLALATFLGAGLGGDPRVALAQGAERRVPDMPPTSAKEPIPAQIPEKVERNFAAARQADDNRQAAEALRLQQQVIAWVQENLPRLHPYRASALVNFGNYLSQLGRHQEALGPTLEAVEIMRQLAKNKPALGKDLATALNNLGNRYSVLGRRHEALGPTLEALDIYRELVKANPALRADLAIALNNLGVIYSNLGRHPDALGPTLEAAGIYRELAKSKQAFLGDLAMALNNLGVMYSNLGRRQEALAPTKEALEITRELVKTNPALRSDLTGALDNLGVMYNNLNRSQEALGTTLEALEITRELVKTDSAFRSDLAVALDHLGVFYKNLDRRQEALGATLEALEIYRELAKTNTAFENGLARSASNLAIISIAMGNITAAISLLRESVSTEVTYLQRELPLLPESRRQGLLEVFGDRWQIPFSVAQQGEGGAALALFTRLNRQGLLQELQRNQALLARGEGPWRQLVEQVQRLTAQLAASNLPQAERQRLQEQKEQNEQRLYQLLPEIKPRLVESAQIAAALKVVAPQGALLEFQQYSPYGAGNHKEQTLGSLRYVALLLRHDGTIRAIPLGDAAEIDRAVANVLELSERKRLNVDEALQAASDRILGPLRSELTGVKQLFVSPDGELNRLPFAALPYPTQPAPGGHWRLLSEVVQLRLLTSGRDLLRLQNPAITAGGPAALVANPDFDTAATGREASLPLWRPLAGTAKEATALAPLLQAPQPLTGSQATVSRVLATRKPRILHIASHGFFWSQEQARALATQQAQICGGSAAIPPAPAGRGSRVTADGVAIDTARVSTSPSSTASPTQTLEAMQRSGIVLAGANHPCGSSDQDGYLTAAEATGMDLVGTELTTLSACQTGLGEVRSGEGVYGLQRALTVAGSRSTLLSLWKVDDDATQAFMTAYYQRLRRGEGRADALAATQAQFRASDTYNHIYYWGSFQLTGDWRPIQR